MTRATTFSMEPPFTVIGRAVYGGHMVPFNQHDSFPEAETEAIRVAQGKQEEELDRVWIEDVGGDIVWSVGP